MDQHVHPKLFEQVLCADNNSSAPRQDNQDSEFFIRQSQESTPMQRLVTWGVDLQPRDRQHRR